MAIAVGHHEVVGVERTPSVDPSELGPPTRRRADVRIAVVLEPARR